MTTALDTQLENAQDALRKARLAEEAAYERYLYERQQRRIAEYRLSVLRRREQREASEAEESGE